MSSDEKTICGEISASTSCFYCNNHDKTAENNHSCQYNNPEHKEDCSLCKNSLKRKLSFHAQSTKIICIEKSPFGNISIQIEPKTLLDERQSSEAGTSSTLNIEFKSEHGLIGVQSDLESSEDESVQPAEQNDNLSGTSSSSETNVGSKIVKKSLGFNKSSTFPPFQARVENDTNFRLAPLAYPINSFDTNDREALMNFMKDPLTDASFTRYQLSILDKGTVKIKCSNIESANQILSEVNTLAYCPDNSVNQCEIIATAASDINFYIEVACTINRETEWDKFRKCICKSNNMHDAWLYYRNSERTSDGRFKITFLVDPLTFNEKMSSDLLLSYGGEQINVEVINNRYTTDIEAFAQQRNLHH